MSGDLIAALHAVAPGVEVRGELLYRGEQSLPLILSAIGEGGEPVLLSPEDFKAQYYEGKWVDLPMTAYHILRHAQFWKKASGYNWLLFGDKNVFPVVNGEGVGDVPRFRVKSLIRIKNETPVLTLLEGRSPLDPILPSPTPLNPPRIAGKPAFQAEIQGSGPDEFSGTALSYALWALDCLQGKRYEEARSHLITALKKSGAYCSPRKSKSG